MDIYQPRRQLSTKMLTILSIFADNLKSRSESPSMKITAVETIYLPRGITVHAGAITYLWVRIHTDDGLIGVGESYPNAEAEAAVVHSRLAAVLLGRDPSAIDRLWADMFLAVSYSGWAGAEMRAISAVDIALWDLFGKATGQPIYKLLGGASRQSIRIYNTCYDRVDFNREPAQLARELLASNVRAMKIWPFDPIAKETGGNHISADATAPRNRTVAHYSRGIWRLDRGRNRVSRFLESALRNQNRRRLRRPICRCGWRRCCRRIIWLPMPNWRALLNFRSA